MKTMENINTDILSSELVGFGERIGLSFFFSKMSQSSLLCLLFMEINNELV